MSATTSSVSSAAASLHSLTAKTIAISSSVPPERTLPSELGIAELMAWLTTQLADSDASIRNEMEQIGGAKQQNEQLSQMKTDLDRARNNSSADVDIGGYGDPNWVHEQDFYKRMSPAQQAQVDNFLATVRDDGKGGHIASGDALKNFCDVLGDQITANTSNNEMAMIHLQSEISARGQKMQIASSIIASIHEIDKNIIGKIA
jgi:hypothetical protein